MKKTFSAVVLLMTMAACEVDKDERKSMFAKNEQRSTHCLGRHFADLPVSFLPSSVTTGIFKPAGLSADDPAFEIVVRSAALTRPQFAAEVRKRREELRKKGSETTNVLRVEKTLGDDATLFRVQRIADAYVSEIYFLRGGSLVSVSLKSYDNKFQAAEERLLDLADAIKPNDSTTRREPHGYCLGPVVVTGTFEEESGRFLFRDGKGNKFGVETNTYESGGPPLLARMSGTGSLLSIFKVGHTVLRTRERNVAGMPAQEWLGWTNLGRDGNEKTFKFALETMPHTPNKDSPSMTLSFDTAQSLQDGTPTKTVMSDEEAIQFWDSVVQSIRQAKS